MKKISELFPDFENILRASSGINKGDCEINGNAMVSDIVCNSRKASEGSLFAAINGNTSDGRTFIQDAIRRGAKFIVTEHDSAKPGWVVKIYRQDGVIFIAVSDVRKELARLCSKFWEYNFKNIAAVTGTNGKSSTVNICSQIWNLYGIDSASIGTLGVITKDLTMENTLTTPDSVSLGHIFNALKQKHIQNIAMEASSHGLAQHRLDYIKLSVCAFTNFTQDHLDYHKTFENYWQAKERLFSELAGRDTVFVVNADDPKSENIFNIGRMKNIRCIDYGKYAGDIKLIASEEYGSGQKVHISFFGEEKKFHLPLAGSFQIYNVLCAVGICFASGVPVEKILEYASKLTPINGRLELISKNIYIDYAHTPDALKNALQSLRKHTADKLFVVFGCGGERDHDKRKLMGAAAQQLADEVIVTDDNPRGEDPAEIRKMILEGCPNAAEIPDRVSAIKIAISKLKSTDILLVAGKGHEDYQILASGKVPFSDREVIRKVIGLK